MKNTILTIALLLAAPTVGFTADGANVPNNETKTVTLTQDELTRLVQAEVTKALAQQAAADVYKKLQADLGPESSKK